MHYSSIQVGKKFVCDDDYKYRSRYSLQSSSFYTSLKLWSLGNHSLCFSLNKVTITMMIMVDPAFKGLIPGLGIICRLNLLLVLVLAPRGFPLSSKTNISKFQFDLESVSNKCSALKD